MTTNQQTAKNISQPQEHLSDFNYESRLSAFMELAKSGNTEQFRNEHSINLHAHTFFSKNSHNYSPLAYAWHAAKCGLAYAGIVDFDTLEGLDEFHLAGKILDLKTCVSLESRVRVPAFVDIEINSPGEPGIAYHMGVGFAAVPHDRYLLDSKIQASKRMIDMVSKINLLVSPHMLNFDDVVRLTPNGNVTERHVCEALESLILTELGEKRAAEFWQSRFSIKAKSSTELKSLIRRTFMKIGGKAYIQPHEKSFPTLREMNDFVLTSGAIPTIAWLQGMTEGEQSLDKLLQHHMSLGSAAINIIPARNITNPHLSTLLADVIVTSKRYGLPIFIGTEMNSPEHQFVDDLANPLLSRYVEEFKQGAHIAYGHTVMQRTHNAGYCSEWAQRSFSNVFVKNEFYDAIGAEISPGTEDRLIDISKKMSPEEILSVICS